MYNYATISDRLRTVSWSEYSNLIAKLIQCTDQTFQALTVTFFLTYTNANDKDLKRVRNNTKTTILLRRNCQNYLFIYAPITSDECHACFNLHWINRAARNPEQAKISMSTHRKCDRKGQVTLNFEIKPNCSQSRLLEVFIKIIQSTCVSILLSLHCTSLYFPIKTKATVDR